MKLTTFFFLTLLYISSYGQIKLSKLDGSGLPKNLKYVGHIINAVKWTDRLGLNYVITTETGNVQSKTSDKRGYKDAALYAYHYVVKSDSPVLIWKMYDFNNECDLDLSLYFIDKTFTVTDLDKNGVGEVWLMYKSSCTGDVSPALAKIIMYEGKRNMR